MQPSHVKYQTAPLARAIAERALALKADDVPQDVWDYLQLCLADAVGIAFASRQYDFTTKSLQSLDILGSEGSASIRQPCAHMADTANEAYMGVFNEMPTKGVAPTCRI